MDKAIIVYWSSTGNTEAMANAIADGVKAAGGTPELVFVDSVNVDEYWHSLHLLSDVLQWELRSLMSQLIALYQR